MFQFEIVSLFFAMLAAAFAMAAGIGMLLVRIAGPAMMDPEREDVPELHLATSGKLLAKLLLPSIGMAALSGFFFVLGV